MMKKNVTTSDFLEIGMGASIQIGSDSHAATVIDISHNDTRIVLQEDESIRTDKNGWSESQTYEYKRDPNGELYYATLRADNTWRLKGTQSIVRLGSRRRYYDFSF